MATVKKSVTDNSAVYVNSPSEDVILRISSEQGAYCDPYNYVHFIDHFLGDALDARWSNAKGTNGSTAIDVVAGSQNGNLRITSGATTVVAESLSSLTHGLNYKPSAGGLYFQTVIKPVSSVADVSYFIGFTDTLATTLLEEPITISGTTLTTNATDAVGFVYDTSATNDNWHCQGVRNNTDTAINNTGIAPAAGTEQRLEIYVDVDGTATFLIDGAKVATVGAATSTGTALTPICSVMSRTTAAKSADFDFVQVAKQRL